VSISDLLRCGQQSATCLRRTLSNTYVLYLLFLFIGQHYISKRV